jgi:hypothetical protein
VNEYTASNGAKVVLTNAGQTGYVLAEDDGTVASAYLGFEQMKAWREFARAEEDERLGRWRWPENPEYVVYPPIRDRDKIAVVNEATGNSALYGANSPTFAATSGLMSDWTRVARAYFDAHPEPTPAWYEAREGEVWVLCLLDEAWELPYIVVDDTDGHTVTGPRFFPVPPPAPNEPGWRPGRFPSDFANGRRIYPDGDS